MMQLLDCFNTKNFIGKDCMELAALLGVEYIIFFKRYVVKATRTYKI